MKGNARNSGNKATFARKNKALADGGVTTPTQDLLPPGSKGLLFWSTLPLLLIYQRVAYAQRKSAVSPPVEDTRRGCTPYMVGRNNIA